MVGVEQVCHSHPFRRGAIELMEGQVWPMRWTAPPRDRVVRRDTRGPGRDHTHPHQSGRPDRRGHELSCTISSGFDSWSESDWLLPQVHPAASYAKTVKKNGGTVAVFNLAPSQGDDQADFVFYGPCEGTIPALLERVERVITGVE